MLNSVNQVLGFGNQRALRVQMQEDLVLQIHRGAVLQPQLQVEHALCDDLCAGTFGQWSDELSTLVECLTTSMK